MKNLLLVFVVLSVFSCEPDPIEVLGCTDPSASNYNAEATSDDGSCYYPPTPVDTTHRFVLVEYTDQDNYSSLDLRYSVNSSSYSDALEFGTTEKIISAVDNGNGLKSSVENHLITMSSVYGIDEDENKYFYEKVNITSPLEIRVFRESDETVIASITINPTSSASTDLVLDDWYYVRGPEGPMHTWFIRV